MTDTEPSPTHGYKMTDTLRLFFMVPLRCHNRSTFTAPFLEADQCAVRKLLEVVDIQWSGFVGSLHARIGEKLSAPQL